MAKDQVQFIKDELGELIKELDLVEKKVKELFADAEINDYHEDFTDAATVVEGMQTAYQVGKGYLSDILKEKDEDTQDHKDDNQEIRKKAIKNKTKVKDLKE